MRYMDDPESPPLFAYLHSIRRKFRSQTSDNMDRWKAEQGRGREKRKIRRKKMQMREKVGKSRNTVFFQWFVAPEGRKVGSLKRRVRSQLARWEMKNCTPLWREAHLEVKMYKTLRGSDHFWNLRCRKSARRCGAKHVSKSKGTKHLSIGPLLEVEMSKKCTPLWREAHFQVKMYMLGPLLEVQMSKKCTQLWHEAHFEVKMLKTLGVRTTFGGSDVASLHYTTLYYTTLHYTTLHYTKLHYSLHNTTTTTTQLHSTTLHYTQLRYTTLHYTTLHYITLHYTTLHYLPLHFTTLHYTPLHYSSNYTYNYTTTLHYNTLHYIPLH